ncbi:MAG TPA: 23S rRNA (adenine(2503)-C(2))-methyltransferase RlmN [Candidatus Omnitrophota bacterium]|nr:23S rRNA (adenine(2503)-C(2))-methyltransferase RlmN [Candidatus Omnitrophota bacterium]HSA30180.1 23S rRNA (adenine(2503)-C(2))-methyltransferase RlmN [Candidatus Omnitrophota bacterium]
MSNRNILDLSLPELIQYFEQIGERRFRAQQILNWIYQREAVSFEEMRNLPGPLREQLKKDFEFGWLTAEQRIEAEDETVKYLFPLRDDQKIETVAITAPQRLTLCVSSQAGCKFGCRFCASGLGGWRRQLSAGEILAQILAVKKDLSHRRVTHVVFMGTGEPLDNFDAVMAAIDMINSPEGLNIAIRRITISTCGVIPQMKVLAQAGRQIELAVSLHGYSNETRDMLMPANKKYPLKLLIQTCRDYIEQTHRQVTFEYIMIPGVTLTEEAPEALSDLLKGMNCKVNLIPYNRVAEFDFRQPTRSEIFDFRDRLIKAGVHTTVRWSKGEDVSAACGQLRRGTCK